MQADEAFAWPILGNVRHVKDFFNRLNPECATAGRAYDVGPNYKCLAVRNIRSAIIPVRRSPGRPVKAERERPKIECKFGELKHLHGKGRCRWIGWVKAAVQAFITCSVVNLKRLTRLVMPIPAECSAF